MYALIDRERMVFVYAHANPMALSNIAWIELPNAPTVIVCGDSPSYFDLLTDLELKLLYKNTTGVDHTGYSKAPLMQIVCDLALRLPELQCSAYELQLQAGCIPDGTVDIYCYVRGQYKPALMGDLFAPQGVTVQRSEAEELAANSGKLRFDYRRSTTASASTGHAVRAPLTSTPKPQRPAPSAPRNVAPPPRGSTRETVWQEADRMWEEAGKPTAMTTVLALRKRIMDALEQKGVKRTSSSNELGNWQKTRLA